MVQWNEQKPSRFPCGWNLIYPWESQIEANSSYERYEIPKGPFTKDVLLTPGEGGLQNPDVQLLFECDSSVLSGRRRGRGSRNPGFSRTSFVNGPKL